VTITTATEFDEATAYERLALALLVPLVSINGSDADAVDLRGVSARHSVVMVESVSDGSAEKLTGRLLPLAFGAAWKVVDFSVELAITAGSRKPPPPKLAFEQKIAAVKAGVSPPRPLGIDATLWRAICRSYTESIEYRHAVVHRRASFDLSTHQLMAFDTAKQPLPTVDAGELRAFCRLAQRLAEVITTGTLRDRSRDDLRALAQVLPAAWRTSLGATPVGAVVSVLVRATELANGYFVLDVPAIGSRARSALPQTTRFDVDVELPTRALPRFWFELEQAPNAVHTIDPAAPPAWLLNR